MRILATSAININPTKNKAKNTKTFSSPINNNNPHQLLSYKDFNISFYPNFKARLNRTPENFYDQQFNIDNMPDTVKKYLFEDFAERHHMPPAQLQREAFEYLKIADSVRDIKDMYPDEPLFAHLKELKDTKPSQGILLLLKWDAQTSQTPIFKDPQNKDITTYLLKKVYLEGKTTEELNNDFDKDATDEIKRELGVKDKKYFSPTNIYTLGIRYPKLPYYNSFLATRNDKEYIPPVRKSGITPSDETKEKLSSSMTKWWAGLNQMERSEQIQKMLNGKEMSNSIFAKYQGQIMTIAAAQMGFSEKLSDIFAEKYADENFTIDFPTFSQQQREIMLEFWNKDPEFRAGYSKALQDTIAEFETAYYSEDKKQLEELLNKALELKARVLNKAKEKRNIKREMQKLAQPSSSQPEGKDKSQELQKPQEVFIPQNEQQLNLDSSNTVNKLFRKYETGAMAFFPDNFKKVFMDFLMKNTNLQTRKEIVALCQSNPAKLLNVDENGLKEIQNKLENQREELNDLFNRTHTMTAKTNDFLLNKLLFELTGDPLVFKFERGDVMKYIQENHLESDVLKKHDRLNAEMKKFATTSSSKELDDFSHLDFDTAVILKINQGFKFYPQFSNTLCNIGYMLDLNHQEPDKYKEFLKNYNAAIKYYNNNKSDKTAKDVIIEHMIVDYINWRVKQDKNSVVNYFDKSSAQAQNVRRSNELDKNYDIDFTSLDSLKHAFKQYLHKSTTKYWADASENQFLEYADSYEHLHQEAIATILVLKLDKFKSKLKNNSAADKRKDQIFANTLINSMYDNFAQKYPQTANANNAALNYVLYELTQKPKALTLQAINAGDFIQANHMEKRIREKQNLLRQKYNEYLQPISKDEIDKIYDSDFLPGLIEVLENDAKYDAMYNPQNFKKAQKFILNELYISKDKTTEMLKKYLGNQSAFIRLMREDAIPEDDKEKILEKMAVDYVRALARDINKNEINKQ